jgi:uncharacterized iron-regulated membrane protein
VMLAFEPQIVDWADRDVRRRGRRQPDATRQGADALLAAAQAAYPEARPSAVTLRSDPSATAFVAFGREDGVYLDVYTARVLGKQSATHRLLHQVEEWHRWLGSRAVGEVITGAACFGFLLLLVSGMYLWLKARVLTFRGGLRAKARDFNWHNVIGFWLAPLIFITTTTGLVMSYNWASDLLFRLSGSTPPVRGEARRDTRDRAKDAGPRPALDPLWARAAQQVSGWRSITLRLPSGVDAPVSFTIDTGVAGRPRRSQLALDATTGDVRKWEAYEAQSRGARVRSLVTPVHTGRIGGIAGQTLALLSALGATVLVCTGLGLAIRRFRAWRARGASALEATAA